MKKSVDSYHSSALAWHRKAIEVSLDQRSKTLRRVIIDILQHSSRGHLGSSFSLIEIIRVLYDEILNLDANNPLSKDRDRFILSKGHGCLALYVLLAEKGFFEEKELWRFCKYNALLGGHPNSTKIPGVEASTGSLGHGLPIGVGFALNAKFEKSAHRIFIVLGDGECNEGSVWEAAMCAVKHRLDNLTVIIDYNKYQSYDTTRAVQDLEPFLNKWESFGFSVSEVNGHDIESLKEVFSRVPFVNCRPSAVLCHTVKGKGISFTENNLEWHHKSRISDAEIKALKDGLAG